MTQKSRTYIVKSKWRMHIAADFNFIDDERIICAYDPYDAIKQVNILLNAKIEKADFAGGVEVRTVSVLPVDDVERPPHCPTWPNCTVNIDIQKWHEAPALQCSTKGCDGGGNGILINGRCHKCNGSFVQWRVSRRRLEEDV